MRLLTSTAILGLLAGTAVAAPPQIVADFPVTGSLVQKVLGDLGEVRVLITKGADAHHYQLLPSDAEALQSAELLVWVGPELTPWMTRAMDNLGKSDSMRLLKVPGTHLREYGEQHTHEHAEDEHGHDEHHGHDHDEDDHGHAHTEGDHGHDHAEEEHDHDHAEAGHEGGHDHSHDGVDPHAWLDPYNAQIWLKAIAEDLATRDPENAKTYAANAETAIGEIKELDAELKAMLEPVQDRSFVVFHDAYGYFTSHYGLRPAIAVSLGDASAPSAARLREISAQVSDSGATCAFPEFGHKQSLVQNVIEGSEARIGDELDPGGRGIEIGAGLYQEILQNMGNTVAECLSAES